MQSKDSDYDVRGVFAFDSVRDYVTVHGVPFKTIDKSFEVGPADISRSYMEGDNPAFIRDTELDIVLWDVKKFLGLLNGSNVTPRKWVQSPIRYNQSRWLRQVEESLNHFYDHKGYVAHYLGLANNNYNRYIEDEDDVEAKKYIYIVRGLRQAERVIDSEDPMDVCFSMAEIIRGIDEEKAQAAFADIIERKVKGEELESVGRVEAIDTWIKRKKETIGNRLGELSKKDSDSMHTANYLLHQALGF